MELNLYVNRYLRIKSSVYIFTKYVKEYIPKANIYFTWLESSMIHSAYPQSWPAVFVAWFWSFGTEGLTTCAKIVITTVVSFVDQWCSIPIHLAIDLYLSLCYVTVHRYKIACRVELGSVNWILPCWLICYFAFPDMLAIFHISCRVHTYSIHI